MKKRVNTRRSAMVIMKAPTKLETPPLLISSRSTYVDCILTPRIPLPLEDPGLRHIYLVRNVLFADARTRDDNRFLRGDPGYRFDRIAIVLASRTIYHDWQIYLQISELQSVLINKQNEEKQLKYIVKEIRQEY